jgi:acyl carrier protein
MPIPVESFIKELENALVVPAGRLQPGQVLLELREYDSLNRLSVIAMCDDRYGFVLDVPELDACKTVADLHQLVERCAQRS